MTPPSPAQAEDSYAYWAGALSAALEMSLDDHYMGMGKTVARDTLREYGEWKAARLAEASA